MSASTTERSRGDTPKRRNVPADGPIDAALGFALFYVLVERATPTVVAVVTESLPDLSPSVVRLGLASALWFVLAVTVLDQARRQLAALGVGSDDTGWQIPWDRLVSPGTRRWAPLAGLLVGGAVAAWTFDQAIATAVDLIRIVATLDAAAFVPVEFLGMVVFFVSFSVATHSLDRLVVGGVRSMLTT